MTVSGLKEQLFKTLAGRPHTSGQTLYHLGRILENNEVIGQICNVPNMESHTFYISIQNHSWVERSPQGIQVAAPSTVQTTLHPHQLISPGEVRTRIDPRNERAPLSYIHWLHYNALRALLGYPSYTVSNPSGRPMEVHKQEAINFYTWSNVKWPTIFEKEQELYTTPREIGQGVQYADLEGSVKPILKLQSGSQSPTPLQKLALETMSCTYPLLSIELSPAQLDSINPRFRQRKAKVDAYMQAVHHAWANGLPVPPPPQMDDRPPVAAGAANRQFIVRVGIDTIFLVVRASLVYWFLQPFTRTITGVAYVCWILYEVWQMWNRPPLVPVQAQQRAGAAGGGGAAAAAAPGGGGGGVHGANGHAGGGGVPQNVNANPGGEDANRGGQNDQNTNANTSDNSNPNGSNNNNNNNNQAVALNDAQIDNQHAHLVINGGPEQNGGRGGPGNAPNLWQVYARMGLHAEADAAFGTVQPQQAQWRQVSDGVVSEKQTDPTATASSSSGSSSTPNAEQSTNIRVYRKLGWLHRVWMFISMLVLTIHPRYWTERQQVLRERERELRVLYGPLRDDQEEGNEGRAMGNGGGARAAITNGQALNGNSEEAGKEKKANGVAPAATNPRPPGGWVGGYVNRARRGLL
ncbi:hypothetical protein FRB91_003952 [Serendipita sp. 411]|nr:hypothetical protein FRB91_003952 [Serendipita sp. 411]